MKLETIDINKINPAIYNPRKDLKPGDAEYEKLKKSITEFDMVEPLILNKRGNVLIGGHQRLKVLKEMGRTEVEVSVVDLPPAKEKALNLALNKISGEWDLPLLKDLLEQLDTGEIGDIEITGFDLKEIENLMLQFHVDEVDMPQLADGDKPGFQQMTFTLSDDQAQQVKLAVGKSKGMGAFIDSGNENSNGNALARICETFNGKC
jgi:ParB-like chromosome segregation protein Spo0J